jgi:hypothetical protein
VGSPRGHWIDALTQAWVRATGRNWDPAKDAWLAGPFGKTGGIGESFFEDWAQEHGLVVDEASEGRGLLETIAPALGDDGARHRVHPDVAAFYERTSDFEIDAWSEWSGVFRPFGWLLAALFSRRLQQLNVPLTGLDASRGMTSRVLKLRDPATGEVVRTAWVRRLLATGHVIYAGDYSIGSIPARECAGVKVVFPLPNGNAIVLMRAELAADGSLTLASVGDGFGDAGFYFTLRNPRPRARYVKHMRETIHVYPSGDGGVRADHVLKLFGVVFLRLHYRLRRVAPAP